MESPKRTENRPPRPPVPKFRLIGAGTDTPDFLPPPKSEESSFTALSYDNRESDTSSEEPLDSIFSKKRLQAISDEIVKYISLFQLDECIFKQAIKMLKPQLLEQLKSKKYDAIAIAVIIAAIKKTCQPITMRELLNKTTVSEKQIKKILIVIGDHEELTPTINAFLKQIIQSLKLNDKFYEVCIKLLAILNNLNLIQGEHENILAAAIIKFMGELIFREQGGIVTKLIADHGKCSAYSLRIMHKKLQDNRERIIQEFMRQ